MKKFLTIFFTVASLVGAPIALLAEETPLRNAGFVQTSIWYSKESFFEGDTVRVYTIVFNGSTYRLEGVVEFYDNDILIGSKSFALPGEGRVHDVWVDWVPKEGKHVVTARMAKTVAVFPDGKKYPVAVGSVSTGNSERLVDFDTDHDAVGNKEDADDDGDSVSDIDEVKNGTDPLKKDTDGNGTPDGKELELAALHKALGEANLAKQQTQALGRMEAAATFVEEKIPAPIKQGVASSTNAIENFRAETGYTLRLAKEAKVKEIAGIKEREQRSKDTPPKISEIGDTTEKPAAYAMLALLTFAQYVFEWKVLFYGIIFYVLYRLVRWFVRRARER